VSARTRKGVAGEFERFVTGALGIVAATPTAEADKGCCGTPEEEEVAPPPPKRETPKARPTTLEEARRVFKKWLGNDYDTNALDAMLATLAAERLGGEPIWLLIISGSGNTKTTTVNACSGVGALVVSTITSEAALLSGTEKKSRAKDATGGLLREIGASGVLVIKDFTSILSMNRDLRAQVLGAFREIHDGSWVRKIGNEGGRSIPWEGRIAVIGAVTTAWDTHHSVIASMGDRFILLRVDSKKGRIAAGRQAIRNTDQEKKMQAELSAAVGGVIANMDTAGITLNEQETETVLAAADLVTRARTACEYDYQGNVIDAHAPEMPTRFAKELTQIIRGAVAVGMDRREALRLAIRCACDSMPPLRLAIIDDLVGNVESTTSDVQRRLNKPWKTVDRQLQSLNMLEVLDVVEKPWGEERHRWHYSLAADVHPEALNPELLSDPLSSPEKSVDTPTPHEKKKEGETQTKQDRIHTDKSGEHPPQQTTETQGSGDSCPSCDKPFDLPNPSCSAAHWHGDGETP